MMVNLVGNAVKFTPDGGEVKVRSTFTENLGINNKEINFDIDDSEDEAYIDFDI